NLPEFGIESPRQRDKSPLFDRAGGRLFLQREQLLPTDAAAVTRCPTFDNHSRDSYPTGHVIRCAPPAFTNEAHMAIRHASWAVAALFVAALTASSQAQQPPSRPFTSPQILDVAGGQIRVVMVASGLFHPWSLAFLPDGHSALVVERDGRLRIIR